MKIDYNIEDFIAVNDRVLVIPGPMRTVEYETEVPDKTQGKKGKDGIVTYKMKKGTEELITYLRVGEVVSMSGNLKKGEYTSGYDVGDWVVYREQPNDVFDLMANRQADDKCPRAIRGFDVLSKLSETGVNKIKNLNNE